MRTHKDQSVDDWKRTNLWTHVHLRLLFLLWSLRRVHLRTLHHGRQILRRDHLHLCHLENRLGKKSSETEFIKKIWLSLVWWATYE